MRGLQAFEPVLSTGVRWAEEIFGLTCRKAFIKAVEAARAAAVGRLLIGRCPYGPEGLNFGLNPTGSTPKESRSLSATSGPLCATSILPKRIPRGT